MSKSKIDYFGKILELLKEKQGYLDVLKEARQYYEDLSKTNQLNHNSFVILCLLIYASNDFDGVLIYKNKHKVLFTIIQNFKVDTKPQKDDWDNLFSIQKKLSDDPFCNIYDHIQYFFGSNIVDISNAASILYQTYEKEQGRFISRFYKTIKTATLKSLTNSQNIDEYIYKRGWTKKNDFVEVKEIENLFDVVEAKRNLEFINEMTISLENNVKGNISLNSFN